MVVDVDTELLVSGGRGVLDSLSKLEGPYEAVANAPQCGDVASFASFKGALNKKFDTFSDHSDIMGNRLQECGNCLDDLDDLIGKSADGNLVGADSLTFSKDGHVVAGINEDDASSDSEELDENSELDTYSSDLVVSSNLKPKNNSGISHRGYRTHGIKENTAEAFKNAGENGFWGCETDVRFDANGNLICSHNALQAGQTATSFDDYLKICKDYGMTAIIDLKYAKGVGPADPDLSPAIINAIEEHGMMDSCVLQTNNMIDIPYMRETSSDVRIWMLTDCLDNDRKDLIEEYGVECVNFDGNNNGLAYNKKYLEENGVDSCVWNVFTENSKDNYLKAGATYVMSDNLIGITPYQEGEEDFNNIAN